MALFLETGASVIAAGSTSKAESDSSGINGSELEGNVSVASTYLQRSLSHLPESLIAFHTTEPVAEESIAGSAPALRFMFFTLGGMLLVQIKGE